MPDLVKFFRIREWLHIVGVPFIGYFAASRSLNLGLSGILLLFLTFFSLGFAYSFNEYFDRKSRYTKKYCYISLSALAAALILSTRISKEAVFLTALGAILMIVYSHPLFSLKFKPFIGTLVNSASFTTVFLLGFAAHSSVTFQGLMLAFLIFLISIPFQIIHELEHSSTDKKSGLLTTVGKLGKAEGRYIVYIFSVFSSIAALLISISYNKFSIFALTFGLSLFIVLISRKEKPTTARILIRYAAIIYGILLIISFVSEQKNYNVILISVDTLRADHLGVYGYQRNTSPNIDAFSRDSVVYENAVSQASWTLPSHMSLLTSKYPPQIYPYNLSAIHTDPNYTTQLIKKQYIGHENLASILQNNGYSTAAFVSGGFVAQEFGFDKGFDLYKENYILLSNPAPDITKDVIEWLRNNDETKFFLFVHYFDVHCPYDPLPEFKKFSAGYESKLDLAHLCHESNFTKKLNFSSQEEVFADPEVAHIIAAYDDSILQTDFYVGELIAELKKSGMYDKTMIVLLSDHGETLFNHTGSRYFSDDYPGGYIGHGHSLFKEVLRVPLVIKYPFNEKGRVYSNVNLIDVLPTVLDTLKLNYDGKTFGKGLLNRSNVQDQLSVKGVSEELTYGGYSLVQDKWKLMIKTLNNRTTSFYLYDIYNDPDELKDLSAANPEIVKSLTNQVFGNLTFMWGFALVKSHDEVPELSDNLDSGILIESLRRQGYL